MIEIKLLEPDDCAALCRENDVELQPGTKIYAARDGEQGRAAAFCIFETEGKRGVLRCIQVREAAYEFLTDGMLRAALNYMLLHGVTEAEARCNVDIRLLRRLGFSEKEGVERAAVTEAMFGGCASGSVRNR